MRTRSQGTLGRSGYVVFAAAVLCILLAAGWTQAQTAAEKPKDTADYRLEPYVIESALDRVAYENEGKGMRTTHARVRIQSDAGVRLYGLILFAYASANETGEVEYVHVRKPDGTAIVTPLESVQDLPADVTRVAPFYSDVRVKHVAVKGLAPGDLLEYSFRARIHTPAAPGQFWAEVAFNRESIVLDQKVEVSIPKSRPVKVSSGKLKPAVREEGDRRIFTWTSAHLTREEKEKDGKKKSTEKPPPPIRLSTFQSWEELGRWYSGLQLERVAVTPAIQSKAAELTSNAKSDAEKRAAIYKYVAMQFRYIGIAFGVGRYQPHAAEEVLANQYGDCKDKHTLLAALLRAAGLRAYPALAHSTQEVDPEVPSPTQFDHLISAVPQADGFEWLDTTLEMAPYAYLGAPMRDKQVLVMPDDGPPRLVKTPAEMPFPRSQVFRSEGKLDGKGTLEADVEYLLRGDLELVMRLAFRNTPQHQWQEVAQALSQLAGFGGTVSAVDVSPLEVTEEPLRIRYHYTRKEYSDWENDRTSPPLPRVALATLAEDAPEEPVDLGPPGELLHESRMSLPGGYSLRPLAPVDLVEAFAEYHSSNAFRDGVLETKRRFVLKSAKVSVDDLKAYRKFQKVVNDHEFAFLALRSGSAPVPVSAAVSPEASREAAELVEKARERAQRQDLREAAALLERALAADPEVPEAWMLLGIVRMSTGEMRRGLEAMHKEVALHPRNTQALKTLAFALMSTGRTEEAIPVWRKLMVADPEDRDAPANLGNILLSQKRYEEATRELETAVAQNPESPHLYSILGQAYLAAGNRSKGVEALKKATQLDPGPEMWNNLAYELAEGGEELDLAVEYALKAVQQAETKTGEIRLEHLEDADLWQMNTLGAYWDTLGWVYFRKGNLELAVEYLEAAWDLTQDAFVADHLGQVYERQKRRQEAVAAYAWALATPKLGPAGARGRLEKLLRGKAGVETAIKRARGELSAQRTTKLSRVVAGRASGEFWVLFSREAKIDDVRFIDGDESLRGATPKLMAANLRARIPGSGPVKLVRRGILGCFSAVGGCDFVLLTPDAVRSVQ